MAFIRVRGPRQCLSVELCQLGCTSLSIHQSKLELAAMNGCLVLLIIMYCDLSFELFN